MWTSFANTWLQCPRHSTTVWFANIWNLHVGPAERCIWILESLGPKHSSSSGSPCRERNGKIVILTQTVKVWIAFCFVFLFSFLFCSKISEKQGGGVQCSVLAGFVTLCLLDPTYLLARWTCNIDGSHSLFPLIFKSCASERLNVMTGLSLNARKFCISMS